MFYENAHSLDSDLFKIEAGVNFSFPAHLHGGFELITVTEGKMLVTVDKKQYTVRRGSAVLVFPNQVHSLESRGRSAHVLAIFSQKLVRAYSAVFQSHVPSDNLFCPERDVGTLLSSLSQRCREVGTLELKGVLYSLCAEFDRGREYVPRSSGGELISAVFEFVGSHYRGDCSLSALSAATSYHYTYLSRAFKEITGLSFTDYVNRYRVSEACYLLKNSDRTVLRVALDVGFDSLRTFNRVFLRTVGMPPGEYRRAGRC